MQAREGDDDIMVSCRSTFSCNATGDDEIGVMTARECCVENQDGLSYIVSDQAGVQTCTTCVGKPLVGSAINLHGRTNCWIDSEPVFTQRLGS